MADYGNKPGDGALREGGAPVALPSSDEDLPSTLSDAARRQRTPLTIVRDAWEGTEVVRDAKGAKYLPRNEAEEAYDYNARLNRSVFFNAFKRTVEGLTGLVFRKDVELGEDVPAPIQEHWENIDLAGTHGDVFCRDLLADSLTAGHAAILVDFPDTGGTQYASEEQGPEALRPYWVPIKKEQILSWRTTVENGRTVLAQLVIEECSMVPHGMFGEKKQTLYRVLFRGATEAGQIVVGWKLLDVMPDKRVLVMAEGLYPTQNEIPVAEVKTSGSRSMFDSSPPLLDLAYLNLAHFQMWSDYNTSIHKTCCPVFYAVGISLPVDADGKPQKIVLGPNSALLDQNPTASVGYASHDGAALGSVEQALENLKSDMGTMGLAMLSPQKRAAETAEAKRLDKSTSDSALSVAARGLQDGVERALGFHARYMGQETTGGSVTVNRDYEGLLMEPDVMGAFATLVRDVGLPPRVVLKALAAGGRLPEDEDPELLEAEVLANHAAEQQRKEEAREMFLDQANGQAA